MVSFLEELEESLQAAGEKLKGVVQAGVTVAIAARLAIFCAGKILDPEEVRQIFDALESELLDQFEGDQRKEASEVYVLLRSRVLALSEAEHQE